MSPPPDTSPADVEWLGPRRARCRSNVSRQDQIARRPADAAAQLYLRHPHRAGGYVWTVRQMTKNDPAWRYFEIDASHSPNVTAPEALMALLEKIAARNWRGVRRVAPNPSFLEHQPACKPGSVRHRPLARTIRDGHSSGTMFTHGLEQPTRTASLTSPCGVIAFANIPLCRPYSVLLPVWFAMPFPLPDPRCALTAPFHPSLSEESGSFSVALSLGSPPPDVIRHRMSMEPGLSSPAAFRP